MPTTTNQLVVVVRVAAAAPCPVDLTPIVATAITTFV
jgi:hypothetical protein